MNARDIQESFFAVYWDHAQPLARFNACLLARASREATLEISSRTWDDLIEHERAALRLAIAQIIDLHDSNRKEISRFKNADQSFNHRPEV